MEELAKQNMPFMGLEIEGLKEYEMPHDLPQTSAMKARGLKVNITFCRLQSISPFRFPTWMSCSQQN